MFGALKRCRFRSLASLILVVNVVGELQQKRTLAASRGFLAAARLSCLLYVYREKTNTSKIENGRFLAAFIRISYIIKESYENPVNKSVLHQYPHSHYDNAASIGLR